MLVVNGELIAVAKRVPGHVVGDGEHTIEELVDVVNQDPRRGIGHEKVLTRLEFDHQADAAAGASRATTRDERAGRGRDRLPALDRQPLAPAARPIDVTDIVHPDNREMAVRAAKAIGLDVAGVDFLTTDISRSYQEAAGRSARSTPRRASACTSRPARARRATSPVR